jgi:hypothetical protein
MAERKAETGPASVTCCEDDGDTWRDRRRWSCHHTPPPVRPRSAAAT